MPRETLQGEVAKRLKDLFSSLAEQEGWAIVLMFDKDLKTTIAGTILPDTNEQLADILEEEVQNLRYKKPKLYLVR